MCNNLVHLVRCVQRVLISQKLFFNSAASKSSSFRTFQSTATVIVSSTETMNIYENVFSHIPSAKTPLIMDNTRVYELPSVIRRCLRGSPLRQLHSVPHAYGETHFPPRFNSKRFDGCSSCDNSTRTTAVNV